MTENVLPRPRIHTTSWHEIHRDSVDLARRLAPLGPWSGLVAVSRGGLVPAIIIARDLDLRLIETVCLASYEGDVKGPVRTLKEPCAVVGDGTGWLMIDDLVDSGATAATARALLPKAHYATLYAKPVGRPFVNTFIREVGQDVWVDFPWDRDPQAA